MTHPDLPETRSSRRGGGGTKRSGVGWGGVVKGWLVRVAPHHAQIVGVWAPVNISSVLMPCFINLLQKKDSGNDHR